MMMIVDSDEIRSRVSAMEGPTRQVKGSICQHNPETGESCIITSGGDDYYYDDVEELKDAIRHTMTYCEARNTSWACHNEPELAALADMAGLNDWIAEREAELGISTDY